MANTGPKITGASPAGKVRYRTPTMSATVRDAETDLLKDNIEMFVDGKRVTTFSHDTATDRLQFTPSRAMSRSRHKTGIVARTPKA